MSASDAIEKAVAEVGAAAVIALIGKGIDALSAEPVSSTNIEHKGVAVRVRAILGDRLQSEIQYDLAVDALKKG